MNKGRVAGSEYPKGLPPWLKKRLRLGKCSHTEHVIQEHSLHTVCTGAACPNRNECYSDGTATFLILGDVCTRNCRFCNIPTEEHPPPAEEDEPARVADAAVKMSLSYSVVTSVTRDDMEDGGAQIFAQTVKLLHSRAECLAEVLTPDFEGRNRDIDLVIEAKPEVFNHNLETVKSMYPSVRPQADYQRSLDMLARISASGLIAKSGIMVGVGETDEELFKLFGDLADAGCRLLTIGQYLRPSARNLPVHEFITPEHFEFLREQALNAGLLSVASGPFVRSSYKAREMYESAAKALQS